MNEFFQFGLLALAAYRLQRFITADEFPPSEWLRGKVDSRFGEESSWSTFVQCPYCIGTWITLVVFAVAAQIVSVPLPVIQALAAAGIVGMIGVKE